MPTIALVNYGAPPPRRRRAAVVILVIVVCVVSWSVFPYIMGMRRHLLFVSNQAQCMRDSDVADSIAYTDDEASSQRLLADASGDQQYVACGAGHGRPAAALIPWCWRFVSTEIGGSRPDIGAVLFLGACKNEAGEIRLVEVSADPDQARAAGDFSWVVIRPATTSHAAKGIVHLGTPGRPSSRDGITYYSGRLDPTQQNHFTIIVRGDPGILYSRIFVAR